MGDFETNYVSWVKTIYIRSTKPISQIFNRIRDVTEKQPSGICGYYNGRDDNYRYYKLNICNKPGNITKLFKELKRLAPEIEIATIEWRENWRKLSY